ncbi:hypothetical protein DFH27DRAFT_361820 [Peziza echinospora]|nr:hypothetical protein DFH27DRAFT_361820 [Peziza echinospora]
MSTFLSLLSSSNFYFLILARGSIYTFSSFAQVDIIYNFKGFIIIIISYTSTSGKFTFISKTHVSALKFIIIIILFPDYYGVLGMLSIAMARGRAGRSRSRSS